MPFIELEAFEFMVSRTNCRHLPEYRVLTIGYVEDRSDEPVNLILPLDGDVLTVRRDLYSVCELVQF